MKWLCLVMSVIVAFVIGYGCAEKEQSQTATGTDLWKVISQEKPYTEWGFFQGAEGVMEGKAPHGKFIRAFVNRVGLEAQGPNYPYGTIIGKENFMPDTTLAKLTVMYKVKGFNPDGGDWFWAVYSPDGTVEMEGKIDNCLACHRLRKANDYVYLHSFKSE